MTAQTPPLLAISDLHVRFHTLDGVVEAVGGIDFEVFPGETLGAGRGKRMRQERHRPFNFAAFTVPAG